MTFLETINKFDDYTVMQGATEAEIQKAEAELGVSFSKDYKEYTMAVGAVSVNGHEITGVVKFKRLNVVEATISAKSRINNEITNLYLIENVGIDKSFIWQDESGELYQTVGDNMPTKIGKSLAEYILF